jgi:ketosteroid isomerase-like protein
VYRNLAIIAVLLGVAASCTIQPTPREYIDRQLPASEVRQQMEDALRDRIALLVQALQAGDLNAAQAALSPAEDVVVIGPGSGQHFTGAAQISAILELIAATRPAMLDVTDIQVILTPRGTAAWFFASMELQAPQAAEVAALRMTGVYVEREGTWELKHAHLSFPTDTLLTRRAPQAQRSPPGVE